MYYIQWSGYYDQYVHMPVIPRGWRVWLLLRVVSNIAEKFAFVKRNLAMDMILFIGHGTGHLK